MGMGGQATKAIPDFGRPKRERNVWLLIQPSVFLRRSLYR